MKTTASRLGLILAALLIALSWTMPDHASAQANSLDGQSSEPVLPDPVPNQGVDIPAQAATAITAYGGPAKEVPNTGCTPLNPCALASSNPRKNEPRIGPDD